MTQLEDRLARPPIGETERLRLPQSAALVTGSILGVGIFSFPHAIESYGPISLIAMGVATLGAIALGFRNDEA